jgi:hypothetical protein
MVYQDAAARAERILQGRILYLIVVLGAEILDFRLDDVQLRLGQLDDRSQPLVVTSLG